MSANPWDNLWINQWHGWGKPLFAETITISVVQLDMPPKKKEWKRPTLRLVVMEEVDA